MVHKGNLASGNTPSSKNSIIVFIIVKILVIPFLKQGLSYQHLYDIQEIHETFFFTKSIEQEIYFWMTILSFITASV